MVNDAETEAQTAQGPRTSLLQQMGRAAEHVHVAVNSEEPEWPPTTAHSSHEDPWQKTDPNISPMILRRNRASGIILGCMGTV